MGKEIQQIDEKLERWMSRQHLFFVSTAPRADEGLVNVSPKGLDGLRVLGPHQLVYADVGGSGIETVAHVKENGRITVMMCAFEGPPKIYRFFGNGAVVERGDPKFDELSKHFEHLHVVRNFIVIDVTRIRDACGFGVPQYAFVGNRSSHKKWADGKSPEEIERYQIDHNSESLDGLPGLATGESTPEKQRR